MCGGLRLRSGGVLLAVDELEQAVLHEPSVATRSCSRSVRHFKRELRDIVAVNPTHAHTQTDTAPLHIPVNTFTRLWAVARQVDVCGFVCMRCRSLLGFQLSSVVRKCLPRLVPILQHAGLSFDNLAAQWMLPLLTSSLPLQSSARVLELYLLEVRALAGPAMLVCISAEPRKAQLSR